MRVLRKTFWYHGLELSNVSSLQWTWRTLFWNCNAVFMRARRSHRAIILGKSWSFPDSFSLSIAVVNLKGGRWNVWLAGNGWQKSCWWLVVSFMEPPVIFVCEEEHLGDITSFNRFTVQKHFQWWHCIWGLVGNHTLSNSWTHFFIIGTHYWRSRVPGESRSKQHNIHEPPQNSYLEVRMELQKKNYCCNFMTSFWETRGWITNIKMVQECHINRCLSLSKEERWKLQGNTCTML